jgi:hypothetical protein
MTLSRERPTIGALIVAFLTALVTWGYDLVPDAIPEPVASAGYALVLAAVATVVGKAVQGEWFTRLFGDHAPWADQTHGAAVALALSMDPDIHPDELQLLLQRLGVGTLEEARELIGMDPSGETL